MEVLTKVIGFITQNISELISVIAMFIAALSLLATRKAFMENYRPYVNFNIDEGWDEDFIRFHIVNTGIRVAQNVRVYIGPKLTSDSHTSHSKHKNMDEFYFPFLAPNQKIRTFYEYGPHRYPENGQMTDIEVFDVYITYSYNGREFKDEYICDTSYFYYTIYPPTPIDMSKELYKMRESLESIADAIKGKNR